MVPLQAKRLSDRAMLARVAIYLYLVMWGVSLLLERSPELMVAIGP